MFLIRIDGKIYNKVNNPAAIYDKHLSVLLKIGESEDMQNYYNLIQQSYRIHGFYEEADDICYIDLPRDQEEIDKIFGICDYIGKLHSSINLH